MTVIGIMARKFEADMALIELMQARVASISALVRADFGLSTKWYF